MSWQVVDGLTATLMHIEYEGVEWEIQVRLPDGTSFDREFPTPGAAIDWLFKWANDRGLWFTVQVPEFHRKVRPAPDAHQV